MKILQVNKFFYAQYGTEKYMFSLFDLLEKNGHEVIHFSMQHPKNQPSRQAQYFVPFVDMSEAKANWQSLKAFGRMIYYPLARRKFDQLLTIEKPDIIHLHSIHHQISPSILWAARKHDIPVVQTLHDYKVVCPSYHFPWRDGQVCLECRRGNWLHLLRHRAHKNSWLATLAVMAESLIHGWLKIYENNVDRYIALSKSTAEQLIDFGLDPGKISIVPHYTKNDWHARAADHVAGQGILFVGRLTPDRGLEQLLNVAEALPNQKVTIAGDGPERKALEAKIKLKDIKNIQILGRVDDDRLRKLYQACRVVFFPTQTLETFGLNILEAMASGKPVVASRLGGVKDLVQEGRNGFLYDPKNTSEALVHLQKIIKDDNLALRLGSAGHEMARQFNSIRHYEELFECYQSAITAHQKQKVRETIKQQKISPAASAGERQ